MIDFATVARPLRPSRLARMMACPLSEVIAMTLADETGPAADTGSAVHRAVSTWHETREVNLALRAMRAGVEKYPFADLPIAELHFRGYVADPRNACNLTLNEAQVTLILPPAEGDFTKAEIVIQGTVDQVREEGGRLYVVDLKTGSPEGPDMLQSHCLQLCAYQLAASAKLGRRVTGARIMRTRDYLDMRSKVVKDTPGPAFWEAPWTYTDAQRIIDGVRHRVAEVRRGILYPTPGDQCRFCVGVQNCVRQLPAVLVRPGGPQGQMI